MKIKLVLFLIISTLNPKPLTCYISQIIVNVLFPVVSAYVLSQSHKNQLLFDALNAIITISLILKEEFGISSSLEDLIDDDSIVILELSLLASNIKKEICGDFDGFFSFIKKNEEYKTHNMLSFMLNLRFKSLRFVSFVIGREHVPIVEEYDK